MGPSSGSSSGDLLEACPVRPGGQLGLSAPLNSRQVRRRAAAVPVDVQTALQRGQHHVQVEKLVDGHQGP